MTRADDVRDRSGAPATITPWHFVLAFGLVSLLVDMVYEGARSIIGPYLATLGAGATLVGLVAGVGEFIGYGLRLGAGYLVRRSEHYWGWTIVGYALTVLSVPFIALSGALAPALGLYGAERLGKAVRSPAKDTLLSGASRRTGRGKAFGVHQAMDSTGAVLGPLLLAGVLAATAANYRIAFGVLVIPGLLALAVLFWLRLKVPRPLDWEDERPATVADPAPTRLPRLLWAYVAAVGITSFGIASFPLLAFHAQRSGLVATAAIPVLFAVAMVVDGLTGLVVGGLYDRRGPVVLLVVPVAAAGAAASFGDRVWLVWLGVAVWGMVNGVLDSTVKAVVADLVPGSQRAVAYGWLAFVRGIGLVVAGVALGAAYDVGPGVAVVVLLAANAVALVALAAVLRRVATHQEV